MSDTKTLREALRIAMQHSAWDGDMKVYDALRSIDAALAAQAQAEPYGWAVTGSGQLYFGEFAEHEAKDCARIVGGTAEAFPLYRHTKQPVRQPLTGEQEAAPELLEALEELADLVDHMRAGNYTPDSFTTQPARAVIARVKATGQEGGAE